MILEIGQILMFQTLKLLIMVLSVTYHVPKIWEIIPTHIDKIDKFKIAIKNRKRIWYIRIRIYVYTYI